MSQTPIVGIRAGSLQTALRPQQLQELLVIHDTHSMALTEGRHFGTMKMAILRTENVSLPNNRGGHNRIVVRIDRHANRQFGRQGNRLGISSRWAMYRSMPGSSNPWMGRRRS